MQCGDARRAPRTAAVFRAQSVLDSKWTSQLQTFLLEHNLQIKSACILNRSTLHALGAGVSVLCRSVRNRRMPMSTPEIAI